MSEQSPRSKEVDPERTVKQMSRSAQKLFARAHKVTGHLDRQNSGADRILRVNTDWNDSYRDETEGVELEREGGNGSQVRLSMWGSIRGGPGGFSFRKEVKSADEKVKTLSVQVGKSEVNGSICTGDESALYRDLDIDLEKCRVVAANILWELKDEISPREVDVAEVIAQRTDEEFGSIIEA